mmetsp:Transcript_158981/g.289927  ORF Transcript_158981/g.289927 Transcript_158981/m.289927 type:complete len:110 (+) Transcript_158981:108-437(+)
MELNMHLDLSKQDLMELEMLNDKGRQREGEVTDKEAGLLDGVCLDDILSELPRSRRTSITSSFSVLSWENAHASGSWAVPRDHADYSDYMKLKTLRRIKVENSLPPLKK